MPYREFRQQQVLRQKAELRAYLDGLLVANDRSVSRTAKAAGISRPYLYDLLERAGMETASASATGRRGLWSAYGL